MMQKLDPWDDAVMVARRLEHPSTFLFVLIGAEQWCTKCRDIRPQFDALVSETEQNEVWLRFDVEEHAEFLGDYLPDDLPMLVAYRGAKLLICEVVATTENALGEAVAMVRAGGCFSQHIRDPGIHARLSMQDWAA